ncbi:hypothetical protein MMC14_009569 [Varicellaria rhodocarpa]|nr:hypothetical protein [Varicellaria rhodocarpa]
MDFLTHFPALAPPPGVTLDFTNPESQALMVTVASIICLVLIIPISMLRFYTSLWIKRSLKADDIVCAFAVAGSVAYTAVVLSSVNITGRHQWDVPILPDVPAFLRVSSHEQFACIASIFGLYFRVQLYRSPDLTWNLAPVLTTLVIELNVGTICACLPSLAAFYRHHRLKLSHVAVIKTITYRVNPFRLSRKARDHRLGTHILGSAQGEGKFLKSGDLSNITESSDTTQIEKE